MQQKLLYPSRWESSHFLLLSVALPLPFHQSSVCVGGIKVVLLSSKLQISFASVHLTLCFITVARGATRFSSPLCKVITPTSYHSILRHYLLHYYYYSIRGWRDYFHGTGFIGLYSEEWQQSEEQEDVTCNICHKLRSNWQSCYSRFSPLKPRAEHKCAADSMS